MAFKVYALQRLHAFNFRGVAVVINSRPVIRTGLDVPPGELVPAEGMPPPRAVATDRHRGLKEMTPLCTRICSFLFSWQQV